MAPNPVTIDGTMYQRMSPMRLRVSCASALKYIAPNALYRTQATIFSERWKYFSSGFHHMRIIARFGPTVFEFLHVQMLKMCGYWLFENGDSEVRALAETVDLKQVDGIRTILTMAFVSKPLSRLGLTATSLDKKVNEQHQEFSEGQYLDSN